jgi:hypothetical protein
MDLRGGGPEGPPSPFFEARVKVVGGAVTASSRLVISVTFPERKGLSTFFALAGLHLPRPSVSLGFAPRRRGARSRVPGDTVSSGSLLRKEVTMANKDKGGSKSSKTAASKSLKEKRQAKKAKVTRSGGSSMGASTNR